MGRAEKKGLDYFPLDTEWDIKMQLVKARFGLVGVGCIVELFKLIYHEGYALKWDEDTRVLFAASNHIDEKTLGEIVDYSVGKGVFHAGLFDKLQVLSSTGIQKRWLKIVKSSKRAVSEIDRELDLNTARWVCPEKTPEEIDKTPEEIPSLDEYTPGEMTQTKVKERRIKRNTCTSYSTDTPKAPPEEARDIIPEPVIDQPEPGEYPKMVYAAWAELGAHVYQPSSLWAFASKWSLQVAPYIKGIHSGHVLAAIGNLKTIYEAPPGTYYWTQKVGVEAFFSKHLEKFLPANFDPRDFRVRAASWEEKQEAGNRAAILAVFGEDAI